MITGTKRISVNNEFNSLDQNMIICFIVEQLKICCLCEIETKTMHKAIALILRATETKTTHKGIALILCAIETKTTHRGIALKLCAIETKTTHKGIAVILHPNITEL